MFNNRIKKIDLIVKWLIYIDKLQRINHELYEHTEYFEHKYMDEFEEDLHRFFGGKIGQFAKWRNQLLGKTEHLKKDEIPLEPLLLEKDLKEILHNYILER